MKTNNIALLLLCCLMSGCGGTLWQSENVNRNFDNGLSHTEDRSTRSQNPFSSTSNPTQTSALNESGIPNILRECIEEERRNAEQPVTQTVEYRMGGEGDRNLVRYSNSWNRNPLVRPLSDCLAIARGQVPYPNPHPATTGTPTPAQVNPYSVVRPYGYGAYGYGGRGLPVGGYGVGPRLYRAP